MIITNKLVKIHFEGFPPGTTKWPLGTYIPEGILDPSHLQVRWRTATNYWSAWFPSLIQWDEATKTGTWVPNPGIVPTEVEIRRVTPRYSLWRDPQDPTSRVSQPHLQSNADQGLMVALEWAADYGVNGHDTIIPGDGPVLTGTMHTQNHWGPEADFHQKVWNFQFTGGYLDKTHVRAQARVDGVWQSLPIDYAPPPVASPFRMHGEYQLYLDLSTLGGVVDGLIIFRRTIREVHVSSPADKATITATNMTPSAKHSFFVSVELGELMSRMVPECECDLTYTTTLLPFFIEDRLGRSAAEITDGGTRNFPVEEFARSPAELAEGVLRDILIQYTTTEQMARNPAALTAGVIEETRKDIFYTNWRDVAPDKTQRNAAVLTAGTLVVTIAYINYTNWRDVAPDVMTRQPASLPGGTLT